MGQTAFGRVTLTVLHDILVEGIRSLKLTSTVAEISPIFSTSAGNHIVNFSGVF